LKNEGKSIMNSKLRKIIRDVALGALVGILPSGKADATIIGSTIDDRLSSLDSDPNISSDRPVPTLKLVYNTATEEGMFHRSHRSHSSHRSHYSSSSGTNVTTTKPTTTKPTTNTSSSQGIMTTPNKSIPSNSTSDKTFGGRNLKIWMVGNDVLELKKELVKAKCYKMGEFEVLNDTFDEKTENALNLFKKNHQLKEDGIADAVVFYHLQND